MFKVRLIFEDKKIFTNHELCATSEIFYSQLNDNFHLQSCFKDKSDLFCMELSRVPYLTYTVRVGVVILLRTQFCHTQNQCSLFYYRANKIYSIANNKENLRERKYEKSIAKNKQLTKAISS